MPAVIATFIAISVSIQEIMRKKRADQLLQRASSLIKGMKDKPIDLLATNLGSKYLTANSTLNHAEKKIRFAEKSSGSNRGFDFPKRFRSFDDRLKELEKRTTQLEHMI